MWSWFRSPPGWWKQVLRNKHTRYFLESIWYLFFESIWYHFLESIWYPSDLTWNPNIRSIRWFADCSKLLIGFLLIFQLILLIFQLIFQLILGEIDVSLQEFGDPSLRLFLAAKATKVYQDPGIQGTQWETLVPGGGWEIPNEKWRSSWGNHRNESKCCWWLLVVRCDW